MIATERDHARKCLSVLAHALHLSIRGWFAHEDAIVAVLDLLDGEGVVVGRHGNVSTVQNCRPAVERVRG